MRPFASLGPPRPTPRGRNCDAHEVLGPCEPVASTLPAWVRGTVRLLGQLGRSAAVIAVTAAVSVGCADQRVHEVKPGASGSALTDPERGYELPEQAIAEALAARGIAFVWPCPYTPEYTRSGSWHCLSTGAGSPRLTTAGVLAEVRRVNEFHFSRYAVMLDHAEGQRNRWRVVDVWPIEVLPESVLEGNGSAFDPVEQLGKSGFHPNKPDGRPVQNGDAPKEQFEAQYDDWERVLDARDQRDEAVRMGVPIPEQPPERREAEENFERMRKKYADRWHESWSQLPPGTPTFEEVFGPAEPSGPDDSASPSGH
jgi:hypothetical protein